MTDGAAAVSGAATCKIADKHRTRLAARRRSSHPTRGARSGRAWGWLGACAAGSSSPARAGPTAPIFSAPAEGVAAPGRPSPPAIESAVMPVSAAMSRMRSGRQRPRPLRGCAPGDALELAPTKAPRYKACFAPPAREADSVVGGSAGCPLALAQSASETLANASPARAFARMLRTQRTVHSAEIAPWGGRRGGPHFGPMLACALGTMPSCVLLCTGAGSATRRSGTERCASSQTLKRKPPAQSGRQERCNAYLCAFSCFFLIIYLYIKDLY